MSIEALNDSIFFEFTQTINKGFFHHETDWGFTMDKTADYDVNKSRWGLVKQVGPDVTLIKEGDYIFIEGGKWTTAIEIDGKKLWRTKEDFVEAVSYTKPEAQN